MKSIFFGASMLIALLLSACEVLPPEPPENNKFENCRYSTNPGLAKVHQNEYEERKGNCLNSPSVKLF